MSQNEIVSKIEQLKEWEAILEEAQTEVEALRDSIKAAMLERGTEELQAGTYIIRWTSVLSNRFDSTAFKKEYGVTVNEFLTEVRLNEAVKMMKMGEKSIGEIAISAGFADQSYFSKVFSANYGVPPSVYMNTALKG